MYRNLSLSLSHRQVIRYRGTMAPYWTQRWWDEIVVFANIYQLTDWDWPDQTPNLTWTPSSRGAVGGHRLVFSNLFLQIFVRLLSSLSSLDSNGKYVLGWLDHYLSLKLSFSQKMFCKKISLEILKIVDDILHHWGQVFSFNFASNKLKIELKSLVCQLSVAGGLNLKSWLVFTSFRMHFISFWLLYVFLVIALQP